MNAQTHEPYFEDLQAYLDQELAPADRKKVAEHLAACESCRALLDDLKAVSGVMGSWEAPEPTGLPSAKELMEKAKNEQSSVVTHASWWSPARSWGAVAAAAILTASIGFVVLRSGDGEKLTARQKAAEAPPATLADKNAGPPEAGFVAPGIAGAPTTQAPGTPPPDSQTAEKSTDNQHAKDHAEAAPKTEGVADGVVVGGVASTTAPAPPPPPAGAPVQEPAAMVPADQPAVAQTEAKEMVGEDDADASKKAKVTRDEENEVAAAKPRSRSAAGGRAAAPSRSAGEEQDERKRDQSQLSKSVTVRIDARASERAVDRVSSVAASSGGRITSRNANVSGTTRTTRMVITVPTSRFDTALSNLRGIGRARESGYKQQGPSSGESERRDNASSASASTIEVVVVESEVGN